MVTRQYDISEGKFAISMSDLLKLLGIVAAVGMSYAMASSRLSLIEKGIRDGQESVIRLESRIKALEDYTIEHDAISNDQFHAYDLRIQSIEERLFGESRSTGMPPRRSVPRPGSTTTRAGAAPARTAVTPPNQYRYNPYYNTPRPSQQEKSTPKDREKQYRNLNL